MIAKKFLGLNQQHVIEMLTYYQNNGLVLPDLNETLALMKVWYGNYRFSEEATSTLFNTNMVWYFVSNLLDLGKYPKQMIDPNVKVDYEKLRHLVVLDRRLNGNFSHLRKIIQTGGISGEIALSFPSEGLYQTQELYFFAVLLWFIKLPSRRRTYYPQSYYTEIDVRLSP